VLERLVARQLVTYWTQNSLLPDLQSAYRVHHSTETALLKVIGDILLALDSGNLAMLSLLDLSAAFDTVHHHTLLQRLRTSYCLNGIVIKRLTSYLNFQWMPMYGQDTQCRRNIAENFNRLNRVHKRYRQQTDGRAIANSECEREFTCGIQRALADILRSGYVVISTKLVHRLQIRQIVHN